MRHLCLLIPAMVLLSGCQSMGAAFSNTVSGAIDLVSGGGSELEPPKALAPIGPEIEINTLWDEDIGSGDEGYQLALRVTGDDEAVYAASYDGRVAAWKTRSGDEIFEVELDLPLSAGPALGNNTVLLGTSEGEVVALDGSSGETLWKARVSSEVVAPPVAEQGLVIVHTGDGAVFALEEDSGKELWSYGQKVSRLSLRGAAKPRIADETVLIGFAKGRMADLRLSDGKVLWEKQMTVPTGVSELERVIDIDSEPAIKDGILYVTTYQGGMVAAAVLDGEVIWQNREVISQSSPAVTWKTVFVTDIYGDIWSLDETTGRAYWKQTTLHRRQVTAPVVYGDYLAVGDYKGYIHFLNQEDGHLVGRIRICRSPIRTPPEVVGDYLAVYGSDGTVAILEIEALEHE